MSKSVNIEQLVALAAKGMPEAKIMLNMRRSAVQNQDDQVKETSEISFPGYCSSPVGLQELAHLQGRARLVVGLLAQLLNTRRGDVQQYHTTV